MYREAGRAATRRDTGLFLICVALSLLALILPSEWSAGIRGSIRETALRPFILLQRFAEEGRTSRARYQAALTERDSALMALRSSAVIAAENADLRALLGLRDRTDETFLAADVLHQPLPTDGETLLLGVGTGEGVSIYQPVVVAAGLVGVVVDAGPASSIANTWAHPEFRASAVTEDGSVLGIVAPTPAATAELTTLEFRGVPYRDTIPSGTLVVTSGLGGVYPRGLPIGWISGVGREEVGWERIYQIRPAVNLGSVHHVLLLRPEPATPDSTKAP